MSEIEQFEFIDLYEGLANHSIKKSTLRFIGLSQDEFDGVEKLNLESFEAAVKKINQSREKESESEKEKELEATRRSQARLTLQFPLVLQEDLLQRPAANNLLLYSPTIKEAKANELDNPAGIKSEVQRISLTTYKPFPSSADFAAPSSEFHEIQYDEDEATLTTIKEDESQMFDVPRTSSPFTESSIISTRSTKRPKFENNTSSDQFRPISSDVQILTSDKLLDF